MHLLPYKKSTADFWKNLKPELFTCQQFSSLPLLVHYCVSWTVTQTFDQQNNMNSSAGLCCISSTHVLPCSEKHCYIVLLRDQSSTELLEKTGNKDTGDKILKLIWSPGSSSPLCSKFNFVTFSSELEVSWLLNTFSSGLFVLGGLTV